MPRRPIGRRRRYLSIRERSTTKDNLGERLDSYTEVFKIWAHIRHGRQQVRDERGSPVTENTLLLNTHYREGFKPGGVQRAVDLHSNRVYRIDSVIDIDERRQEIDIVAVEIPVQFPQ